MNLSEAITELKERGAHYLEDDRLTIMLNDAKNDFEDAYNWPWLEATTSGEAPLEISSLRQILYVVDSDHDSVLTGTTSTDVIMQESWRDVGTSSDTGGRADYWYIDGDTTLSVFPSSDAELYVRYMRYSDELSASDDEPLIPVRYHNLWIDFAMVRVYRDSDDFDRASSLLTICLQRLQTIYNDYATRNLQNHTVQQIFTGSDW